MKKYLITVVEITLKELEKEFKKYLKNTMRYTGNITIESSYIDKDTFVVDTYFTNPKNKELLLQGIGINLNETSSDITETILHKIYNTTTIKIEPGNTNNDIKISF